MNEPIKREYFDLIKSDFLKVAGVSEGEFLREIGFAIQQINKNPQLMTASKQSIYQAIMNVAQIGLSLNPITQYAYLIPRWSRQTGNVEASLEPSYKGLMKLLTDTGTVKSIEVRLVYSGEECIVDYASAEKIIKHIPNVFSGNEPTDIMGVYSLAVLNDGSKHLEAMSKKQLDDIREISESWVAFKSGKVKNCIWNQSPEEMYRKTVIKRHFKFLPKSEVFTEKIDNAIELDNKNNGFRELIEDNMVTYCLSLINHSTLEEHIKVNYESELLTFEYQDQAYKMINVLKDCQISNIEAGRPYNQGDILKELDKISSKNYGQDGIGLSSEKISKLL